MLWQPSIVRWKAEMYSISDQQENLIMLLLPRVAAHQSCETAILLGLVLATALSSARAVKRRPRELEYSIPDLPANLIVLYPSKRT